MMLLLFTYLVIPQSCLVFTWDRGGGILFDGSCPLFTNATDQLGEGDRQLLGQLNKLNEKNVDIKRYC